MSGDHLSKLNMSTSSFNANNSSSNSTISGMVGGVISSTNTNKSASIINQLAATTLSSSSSGLSTNNNTTTSTSILSTTTTTSLTNQHRYIKLNIGGRLFSTSIDTLTKQDNMLRAMFSGRMDLITDLDGYILIDRCGKHFELILNYLRDEDTQGICLSLNDKSELELYEILKEAKFYCIQPLINIIEQKILSNKAMNSAIEPYYGSSIVSMITSKNDLVKILNSTDKPCIRLLINRHNNKYSYTNTSDDNLLKNIELFERMAIKFKNRIMFIKDTTSNEEICCWYFHGNGKKLAEVCCTSIVYTTEKKQTKVEFPDSKILEEIFVNAVLFESKETNNNQNNNNNGNYNQENNSTVSFLNADEEAYSDNNITNSNSTNTSSNINGTSTSVSTSSNGNGNGSSSSSSSSALVGSLNSVGTANNVIGNVSNTSSNQSSNNNNINSVNNNSGSNNNGVANSSNSNSSSNTTNLIASSSSSVINSSNIISIANSRRGAR